MDELEQSTLRSRLRLPGEKVEEVEKKFKVLPEEAEAMELDEIEQEKVLRAASTHSYCAKCYRFIG